MKVLIIEDHPTDRKLMSAVLEKNGHSVFERCSAEGALDAILAARPDIILLDLLLPGVDGLTFSRELKSNGHTCEIPIVAVTAYPERYRREELLGAGCEVCIVKPFDTRDLARQVEDVAGRK